MSTLSHLSVVVHNDNDDDDDDDNDGENDDCFDADATYLSRPSLS